jgi:hypothetical protein
MRIQPRQQLLKVWHATARASFQDDKWVREGRDGSNSISDAEQLLCILYPATELPSFRLGKPDATADDALEALQHLGGHIEIPKLLVRELTEYMMRYTNAAGYPTFSGGSYFQPHEAGTEPSVAQGELDIVDSFSMSITLTLAALTFTRSFRSEIRREDLRQEVDKLEKLASIRLTSAMIGLLRSFSINVFDERSPAGRILCRRSNKNNNLPERQVARELRDALAQVKSGLRDITIGSAQDVDMESNSRLFECGWSWGIVEGAAPIETPEDVEQVGGVAVNSPYLHFTNVALAGLADLFSERTRLLGLLNEDQRRLSQALQIRWDLTQSYWSTIATFGAGRWPLEDFPWCTSDGQETDYYSLLVTAMVVQEMVRSRASDAELGRVLRVLEELANRGRIDRRPLQDDPSLSLHYPGVRLGLKGSETLGDRPIGWLVWNFSPLLLKRTLAIAGLVRDAELRGRLLTLADNVWDHLFLRQLDEGHGRDLWDQPIDAYPQLSDRYELPSWYYTERVIECLVEAAHVVNRAPVHSTQLTNLAVDLLHEADHLFDRELLRGSGEAASMRDALQRIRGNLRRAWEIRDDRPGSAMVLASEVLRDLEGLTSARQNVAEGI